MRAQRYFLTLLLVSSFVAAEGGTAFAQYPRIANLWGGSILSKDYPTWAKYDLLVMGGGSPEAWRRFRKEVTAINPSILLLGTAPLMNLGAPESTPWMKETWYLRRPSGEKINWWAGQIYVPNLLREDCLAALVDRTAQDYGEILRVGTADGVFYDSVVGSATWLGEVDTDGDGKADVAADVNPRWHQQQCLFFDRLRERWPGLRILANDVDLGHAPHVNGRLFEGGPLLDRVADGSLSPADAIHDLNEWMTTSAQPALTFALMTHPLGWQGWRVGCGDKVTTRGELDRVKRDFQRMRLGLLTTLMTDAYFAYDFGTVWYGLPFWYAEYDAPLGKPLSLAREIFEVPPATVVDWKSGQPADAFVIDAPSSITAQGIEGAVEDEGNGWCRLFATDLQKVPLQPGKTYRIEAECEVLRKPTSTFQFNVRTGKGGWEHHDKGVLHNADDDGSLWRLRATIVPDNFDDYAAEWHLLGAGALRLKILRISLLNESYFLREFEGGIAVLNPTQHPITIRLPKPMRRIKDDAAPLHTVEVDDDSPGFWAQGAWELLAGETHYVGNTYRLAAKPGAEAHWKFKSPSTDTYTLSATFPGGKNLTNSVEYAVRRLRGGPSVILSQRAGDGGWCKLVQVKLKAGEECEVVLRSGGTGATAADAICAESTARFNDGALVTQIALGGLDGTVLLSK